MGRGGGQHFATGGMGRGGGQHFATGGMGGGGDQHVTRGGEWAGARGATLEPAVQLPLTAEYLELHDGHLKFKEDVEDIKALLYAENAQNKLHTYNENISDAWSEFLNTSKFPEEKDWNIMHEEYPATEMNTLPSTTSSTWDDSPLEFADISWQQDVLTAATESIGDIMDSNDLVAFPDIHEIQGFMSGGRSAEMARYDCNGNSRIKLMRRVVKTTANHGDDSEEKNPTPSLCKCMYFEWHTEDRIRTTRIGMGLVSAYVKSQDGAKPFKVLSMSSHGEIEFTHALLIRTSEPGKVHWLGTGSYHGQNLGHSRFPLVYNSVKSDWKELPPIPHMIMYRTLLHNSGLDAVKAKWELVGTLQSIGTVYAIALEGRDCVDLFMVRSVFQSTFERVEVPPPSHLPGELRNFNFKNETNKVLESAGLKGQRPMPALLSNQRTIHQQPPAPLTHQPPARVGNARRPPGAGGRAAGTPVSHATNPDQASVPNKPDPVNISDPNEFPALSSPSVQSSSLDTKTPAKKTAMKYKFIDMTSEHDFEDAFMGSEFPGHEGSLGDEFDMMDEDSMLAWDEFEKMGCPADQQYTSKSYMQPPSLRAPEAVQTHQRRHVSSRPIMNCY
jgi:hypothetical protein